MSEAFEIGVTLALSDGVSEGMAQARKDMAQLEQVLRAGGVSVQQLRAASVGALSAMRPAPVATTQVKQPTGVGETVPAMPQPAPAPGATGRAADAGREDDGVVAAAPARQEMAATEAARPLGVPPTVREPVVPERVAAPERMAAPPAATPVEQAVPAAVPVEQAVPMAVPVAARGDVPAAPRTVERVSSDPPVPPGAVGRTTPEAPTPRPAEVRAVPVPDPPVSPAATWSPPPAAPGLVSVSAPVTLTQVMAPALQPVADPAGGPVSAQGLAAPAAATAGGVAAAAWPARPEQAGTQVVPTAVAPAWRPPSRDGRAEADVPAQAMPPTPMAAAAALPQRVAPFGGAGTEAEQEVMAAAAQSPAAPPAAAPASGPTEGDVYLDGALVGRWMSRFLTQEAARASAGPTGYDARRGRLLPGATVGG